MSWTKKADQPMLPMRDLPPSDNDVVYQVTVRNVRENFTIYLGRELKDDELNRILKVITFPSWSSDDDLMEGILSDAGIDNP